MAAAPEITAVGRYRHSNLRRQANMSVKTTTEVGRLSVKPFYFGGVRIPFKFEVSRNGHAANDTRPSVPSLETVWSFARGGAVRKNFVKELLVPGEQIGDFDGSTNTAPVLTGQFHQMRVDGFLPRRTRTVVLRDSSTGAVTKTEVPKTKLPKGKKYALEVARRRLTVGADGALGFDSSK